MKSFQKRKSLIAGVIALIMILQSPVEVFSSLAAVGTNQPETVDNNEKVYEESETETEAETETDELEEETTQAADNEMNAVFETDEQLFSVLSDDGSVLPIKLEAEFIDENGNVYDTDEDGNNLKKEQMVKSGESVTAKFTLIPDGWRSGQQASQIYIYINLAYLNNEGVVVKDEVTNNYVKGTLRPDDDSFLNQTPEGADRGDHLLVFYPSLNSYSQPSFKVEFSFEGQNLVEGASAQVSGYIYHGDSREENAAWKTPEAVDAGSILTLINSNLEWSTGTVSLNDVVPWDRYNYGSYTHILSNESEKGESTIDGYTSFIEIPTVINTKPANGYVYKQDIIRWIYDEKTGQTRLNENLEEASLYIGKKDKGGVLIYDIRDYVEEKGIPVNEELELQEELTEEMYEEIYNTETPLPYQYLASGMISVKKDEDIVYPPDPEKPYSNQRIYLILVPYSNNFGSLPAQRDVKARTTIYFGPRVEGLVEPKQRTKNSGCITDFLAFYNEADLTKEAIPSPGYYGGNGVFSIYGFKNESNLDIFNSYILDKLPEAGYNTQNMYIMLPQKLDEDDPERDKKVKFNEWMAKGNRYQYEITRYNTVTQEVSYEWIDFTGGYISFQENIPAASSSDSNIYDAYVIDYAAFLRNKPFLTLAKSNEVIELTGSVRFNLKERFYVNEEFPGKVEIHGYVVTLDPIYNEAEGHYDLGTFDIKTVDTAYDMDYITYRYAAGNTVYADAEMPVAVPDLRISAKAFFRPEDGSPDSYGDTVEAGYDIRYSGFGFEIKNVGESGAPESQVTIELPAGLVENSYKGFHTEYLKLYQGFLDCGEFKELHMIDAEDKTKTVVISAEDMEDYEEEEETGIYIITKELWEDTVSRVGQVVAVFDSMNKDFGAGETKIEIYGYADVYEVLTSKGTIDSSSNAVIKPSSDDAYLTVVEPKTNMILQAFNTAGESGSPVAAGFEEEGNGYTVTISNKEAISRDAEPVLSITLPIKGSSHAVEKERRTGFHTQKLVIPEALWKESMIGELRLYDVDGNEPLIIKGEDLVQYAAGDEIVITALNYGAIDTLYKVEIVYQYLEAHLEEAEIVITGMADAYGDLEASAFLAEKAGKKNDISRTAKLVVELPEPLAAGNAYSEHGGGISEAANPTEAAFRAEGSGYIFYYGNDSVSAMPDPVITVDLPVRDEGSFTFEHEEEKAALGFHARKITISEELLDMGNILSIRFYGLNGTEYEWKDFSVYSDQNVWEINCDTWIAHGLDELKRVEILMDRLAAQVLEGGVQIEGMADDYKTASDPYLTASTTLDIYDWKLLDRPVQANASLNVLLANPTISVTPYYGYKETEKEDGSTDIIYDKEYDYLKNGSSSDSGLWDGTHRVTFAGYTRPATYVYQFQNTVKAMAEPGEIKLHIETDFSDQLEKAFLTDEITLTKQFLESADIAEIIIANTDNDRICLRPGENEGEFVVEADVSVEELRTTGETIAVSNEGHLILSDSNILKRVLYPETILIRINSYKGGITHGNNFRDLLNDECILIHGYVTRDPGATGGVYALQQSTATFTTKKTGYSPVVNVDKGSFDVRKHETTVSFSAFHRATVDNTAGSGSGIYTDRTVPRLFSSTQKYYTSGGTTYSYYDWTYDEELNVGYKALASYWLGIEKPEEYYYNVETELEFDVEIPSDKFDLYYLKMHPDLKDRLDYIEIYRSDDDQNPWQKIEGDIAVDEWVENAQSDYWRINVARKTGDLYADNSDTGDPAHPYYKNPFEKDVIPENPVTRVKIKFKPFDVVDLENMDHLYPSEFGRARGTSINNEKYHLIEFTGRFYTVARNVTLDARLYETRGTTLMDGVDYLRHYENENNSTRCDNSLLGTQYSNYAGVTVTEPTSKVYKGSVNDIADTSIGTTDPGTSSGNNPGDQLKLGERGKYSIGYANWIDYDDRTNVSYNANEWRSELNTAFQDYVVVRDTLKSNALENPDHYFTPETIYITGSGNQYLTSIEFTAKNRSGTILDLADYTLDTKDLNGEFKIDIRYDEPEKRGVTDEYLYLPEGYCVTQIDFILEEIPGHGDTTAEIDSRLKPDDHGIGDYNYNYSSSYVTNESMEVDFEIAGRVDGVGQLINTAQAFRKDNKDGNLVVSSNTNQAGTANTSYQADDGRLVGIPRELEGAVVQEVLSGSEVYDYKTDLFTPNTTSYKFHVENTADPGEADISWMQVSSKIFEHMRLEAIELPEWLFSGTEWNVSEIYLYTADNTGSGSRAYFENDQGDPEYDFSALFEKDAVNNSRILNVEKLFEGSEQGSVVLVPAGGTRAVVQGISAYTEESLTYQQDAVYYVEMKISGVNDTVLEPGEKLFDGTDTITYTGRWVDKNSSRWNGEWDMDWDASRPSNYNRRAADNYTYKFEYDTSAATTVVFHPVNTKYTNVPSYDDNDRDDIVVYNRHAVYEASISSAVMGEYIDNAYKFQDIMEDSTTGIRYDELIPGDTTSVVLQVKNAGTDPKLEANEEGDLPVVNPKSYFSLQNGLKVTGWNLVMKDNSESIITENQIHVYELDEQYQKIVMPEEYDGTAKNFVVEIEGEIDYGNSVYVEIHMEAVHDYTADTSLYGTQGETTGFDVHMRSGFLHGYDSFRVSPISAENLMDTEITEGKQGGVEFTTDFYYAYSSPRLRMYKPANPLISAFYDDENITGHDASIEVSDIKADDHHDRTRLEVVINLDTNGLKGFILDKWPEPEYPDDIEDFEPENDKPQVFYATLEEPDVWIPVDQEWLLDMETEDEVFDFSVVQQIKIDYGEIPAYKDNSDYDSGTPEMPGVILKGKGYWQDKNAPGSNSYVWPVEVTKTLYHYHEGDEIIAAYKSKADNTDTVVKAGPRLIHSLSMYDSLEDARGVGNGLQGTQKITYRPYDTIWNRIYVRNQKVESRSITNTTNISGTGPLLEPVIYDKVPEYLWMPETMGGENPVTGNIDIAAAIEAEDLEIRWYDADGELKKAGEDYAYPTVTVYDIVDEDIGGMQEFDTHVSGHSRIWHARIGVDERAIPNGLFGDYQPDNEKNKATLTTYHIYKYSFSEELGRDEYIEIIYRAVARDENLPVATYLSGGDVYAPYMNMYTRENTNTPSGSTTHLQPMDMSNLLHESGVTGTRNDYLLWGEFLPESYSLIPGNAEARDHSSVTNNYYYDRSLQTGYTHNVYYQESDTLVSPESDTMYLGTGSGSGSSRSDVYTLVMRPRLDPSKNWEGPDPGPETEADENEEPAEVEKNRILWSENSLHLERAWIYAASEILSEERIQRTDEDKNFYVKLNGNTGGDDYTYALEYMEEFDLRLSAVNYGDGELNGIEMIEILPAGSAPVFDEYGEVVVNGAYYHFAAENAIDLDKVNVTVLQSPDDDQGFRAPSSLMEGAETQRSYYGNDIVPWVLKIEVRETLGKWWNRGDDAKQYKLSVEIRMQVTAENLNEHWYDQLYISPVADVRAEGNKDLFYAVYDKKYGNHNTGNSSFMPDYIADGMEYSRDQYVTSYSYLNRVYYIYYYQRYEPYGQYIRGENVQCLELSGASLEEDMHSGLLKKYFSNNTVIATTGDMARVRKPTVRLWSVFGDGKAEGMHADLYSDVELNIYLHNEYLWPLYNGTYRHQTNGGARGSYFDPVITNILPYGVVPISTDNERWPLDPGNLTREKVDNLRYEFLTGAEGLDSDDFDVYISYLKEDEYNKELGRYMLQFVAKEDVHLKHGEMIQIKVAAYVADLPDASYIDGDSNVQYEESYLEEWQKNYTYTASQREISFIMIENEVSSPYSVGNTINGTGDLRLDSVGRYLGAEGKIELDGTYKPVNTVQRYVETDKSGAMELESYLTGNKARGSRILDENSRRNLNFNNSDGVITENEEIVYTDHGLYNTSRLFTVNPNLYAVKELRGFDNSAALPSEIVLDDQVYSYTDQVWYALTLQNRPEEQYTGTYARKEELAHSGAVLHAQYIYTDYLPRYMSYNNEYYLEIRKTDGSGRELLGREDMAAWGSGFGVELLLDNTGENSDPGLPNIIQFRVTIPKEYFGNDVKFDGYLPSGYEVSVIISAIVDKVPGPDTIGDTSVNWSGDEFANKVYISLEKEDGSFISNERRPDDIEMKTQVLEGIRMSEEKRDDPSEDIFHDLNSTYSKRYAYAETGYELKKPQGTVRKETERQKVPLGEYYDDPAYTGDDEIVFLLDEIHNDGGSAAEMVIEDTLPYPKQSDMIEGSGSVTGEYDWESVLNRVSTGKWMAPSGYQIENYYVYVDYMLYGDSGWRSLTDYNGYPEGVPAAGVPDPNGSDDSIRKQVSLSFDRTPAQMREDPVYKIRWTIKSHYPETIGVPGGFRLDVDADSYKSGIQEKSETDEHKNNVEPHSESILENSIYISMNAQVSRNDISERMPIYNTVDLGVYYSDKEFGWVDTDNTFVYITPTSPTVDIKIIPEYFRMAQQSETENGEAVYGYNWSNTLVVNTAAGKRMKYTLEVTNGEASMWEGEEGKYFHEDALMHPVVVTTLSPVLKVPMEHLKYIPHDEIDETIALSDSYTRTMGEGDMSDAEAGYWTWYVEPAPGTEDDYILDLKEKDVYVGSWPGLTKEIVRFPFHGTLKPGDKLFVEFIASVEESAPSNTMSSYLACTADVLNNSGFILAMNTAAVEADHYISLEVDDFDINDDGRKNDLLVHTSSEGFVYADRQDFPRRKISYSELDPAGTTQPQAAAVTEGGTYRFETTILNTKQNNVYINYPVIFDILPYEGDKEMTGQTNSSTGQFHAEDRGSKWRGYLIPESLGLYLTDGSSEQEAIDASKYEVWLGPVSYDGNNLSAGEPEQVLDSELITADTVKAASKSDAELRALGFVKMNDLVLLKGTLEYEEIVRNLTMIWVQFADKNHRMPPNTMYTLSYEMRAPLNVPYYQGTKLDSSDKNADWSLVEDFTAWNSFISHKDDEAYIIESDKAGVYLLEQDDRVHLGDYVWWDINQDGLLNEGTVEKVNGRDILTEFTDSGDPGINGVQVDLLTPDGHPSDKNGNRVGKATDKSGEEMWAVLTAAGEPQLDNFGRYIPAGEPVSFTTEADVEGRNGYYIMADLVPGNYALKYTFPQTYDYYTITHTEFHNGVKLEMYEPGETLPDHTTATGVTVISDAFELLADQEETYYMDFDLGVDYSLDLGGTVWKDDSVADSNFFVNGILDDGETRLAGYQVTLRESDGEIALNLAGQKMVQQTDSNGEYVFRHLPAYETYYITIEALTDTVILPSPIMHTTKTLERSADNDLYLDKNSGLPRTYSFITDPSEWTRSDIENRKDPIMKADLGLIGNPMGVIGNYIWHDENRNGLQDSGEDGIKGVKVILHQYYLKDNEWVWEKEHVTHSGDDGFYYFKDLPVYEEVEELTGKKVYVKGYKLYLDEESMPEGYTLTVPKETEGVPLNIDSDTIDSDASWLSEVVYLPEEEVPEGEEIPEREFWIGAPMNEDFILLAEEVEGGYDLYTANSELDYDAGFAAFDLGHVSGVVWNDYKDQNGLLNDNDERLPSYQLTLTRKTGNGTFEDVYRHKGTGLIWTEDTPPQGDDYEVYQILTNSEGYYKFDKLPIADDVSREPYTYDIRIETPKAYVELVEKNAGGSGSAAYNSKFSYPGNGSKQDRAFSGEFILASKNPDNHFETYNLFKAANITNMHCGLIVHPHVMQIGSRVWEDTNGNGLQDDIEKEPGIANVTMSLYRFVPDDCSKPQGTGKWEPAEDAIRTTHTTRTDDDGNYYFFVEVAGLDENEEDYLMPYRYRVVMERPYYLTLTEYKAAGEGSQYEAVDSDFQNALEVTDLEDFHKHFSSWKSDRVMAVSREILLVEYADDGKTANMLKPYKDTNIDAGLLAAGSQSDKKEQEDPDNPDEEYKLSKGYVSIGDYVWLDTNRDGLQDDNEYGIWGIEMYLYRFNEQNQEWENVPDAYGKEKTTTNGYGRYSFRVPVADFDVDSERYMMPYRYRIVMKQPYYMVLTSFKAGADSHDSDFKNLYTMSDAQLDDLAGIPQDSILYSVSPEVNLFSGEKPGNILLSEMPYIASNFDIDAGLIKGYGKGDKDDEEDDDENTGNPGEPGGPEEPGPGGPKLPEEPDKPQPPGSYEEDEEDEQIKGWVAIGNYIWEDQNMDGAQGEYEDGISDVRVDLYRYQLDNPADRDPYGEGVWKYLDSTRTSAYGRYSFRVPVANFDDTADDFMVPYRYRMVICHDVNAVPTLYKANGVKESKDSDFWYIKDWIEEEGEAYYRDILSDGTLSKARTLVSREAENLVELDPHAEISNVAMVYTAKNDKDIDGGLMTGSKSVNIGDLVWNDKNGDGIQDESSYSGIEGVELTLYRYEWNDPSDPAGDGEWKPYMMNGSPYKVTSGEYGAYRFRSVPVANFDEGAEDYLVPYRYRVVFERPSISNISPYKVSAATEATDSDFFSYGALTDAEKETLKGINGGVLTAVSREIVLVSTIYPEHLKEYESNIAYMPSAARDSDVDAGLMFPGKEKEDEDEEVEDGYVVIGNYVWHDKNENGRQDESESGVDDFELFLYRFVPDDYKQPMGEGRWEAVTDEKGNNVSTVTSAYGYYRFVVPPAVLDEDAENVLMPYRYRVAAELPFHMLLTEFQNPSAGPGYDSDFKMLSDWLEEEDTGTLGEIHDNATIRTILSPEIVLVDTFEDAPHLAEMHTASSNRDIDLGVLKGDARVDIGDFVWHDRNKNGIQDSDETGIKDVELVLYRFVPDDVSKPNGEGHWTAVRRTRTNDDGYYSFRNVKVANGDIEAEDFLRPYRYLIAMERPYNSALTQYKKGHENEDSDFRNYYELSESEQFKLEGIAHTLLTCISREIPLVDIRSDGTAYMPSSQSDYRVDAGLLFPGDDRDGEEEEEGRDHDEEDFYNGLVIIGDYIWHDENENGAQDEREPAVDGVKMSLYRFIPDDPMALDDNGTWQLVKDARGRSTTVTDEYGYYSFKVPAANYDEDADDFLVPYRYRVMMEVPVNSVLTDYAKKNIGSSRNSDFRYVWEWIDEAEEPAIYDALPGSSLTALSREIKLVDETEGYPHIAYMPSIRSDRSVDGGLLLGDLYVNIGDYVWNDKNQDGVQNSDEHGIADIEMTLLRFIPDEESMLDRQGETGQGSWQIVKDDNGRSTVRTDVDGYYQFRVPVANYNEQDDDFLVPYRYKVAMRLPANAQLSDYQAEDVHEKYNSDFYSILLDEEMMSTAGLVADERTAVSREILLVDEKLDCPGQAYMPSARNDMDVDAGLFLYDTHTFIGDFVWNDVDQNGVQNKGEHGLAGHEVVLYRYEPADISAPEGDGHWVETADLNGNSRMLTGVDGYYEFEVPAAGLDEDADDFLMPYEYRILFARKPGDEYVPYQAEDGMPYYANYGLPTLDEDGRRYEHPDLLRTDGIPEGKNLAISPSIWLAEWEEQEDGKRKVLFETVSSNRNIDFGVHAYEEPDVSVRLGDYVWEDSNNNGIQDSGEVGVQGITVSLYRRAASEKIWSPVEDERGISQIVTGPNGSYFFHVPVLDTDPYSEDFMKPYEYRLLYQKPEGYVYSDIYKARGASEARDNDMMPTLTAVEAGEDIEGIPVGEQYGVSRVAVLYEPGVKGKEIVKMIRSDLDVDAAISYIPEPETEDPEETGETGQTKDPDDESDETGETGKETDETGESGKETDETGGTGKETDETSGSGKETDETGGSGRETDETGGSGKETDETSGSGKETDETGGSGKETDETGGSGKETDETGGSGKETDETGGSGRETDETGGSGKETDETGGSGRETDETSGSGKETDQTRRPGEKETEDRPSTTKPPTVKPPSEDDDEITGEGEPGTEVEVTFPDGSKKITTVDKDGVWRVKVPKGMKLKEGDTIIVVFRKDGEVIEVMEIEVEEKVIPKTGVEDDAFLYLMLCALSMLLLLIAVMKKKEIPELK